MLINGLKVKVGSVMVVWYVLVGHVTGSSL